MSLATSHEKISGQTSAGEPVLFGDVTNTPSWKTARAARETLRSSQFCARTRVVTAAAAASMSAPERGKKISSSPNEIVVEATGHTLQKGGGSVVEENQLSNAMPVILRAEKKFSSQKWTQRPLKFLQKYLFLRHFNAMPSAPGKNKCLTSAPFRPVPVCASVKGAEGSGLSPPPPPPPPPSSEGDEGNVAVRFVRSRCFHAPASCVSFNEGVLCTGEPKSSDGGGSSVNTSTKVGADRCVSADLQRCEGELPVFVGRPFDKDVDFPPPTEMGVNGRKEVEQMAASLNSIGDCQRNFRGCSAIGEVFSPTDGVGIGVITPIDDEEVLIELEGPTTPARHSASALTGANKASPLEKNITGRMSNEPFTRGGPTSNFMRQPSSLLEWSGVLTEGNINHAMVSFAVDHCRNLDESFHAFEGFLSSYFLEQFKVYEAAVLEAAFVMGYIHMVAIPMMKLLEVDDRRTMCMRRDIYIRGLIERFVVELPGKRKTKLPTLLRLFNFRHERRGQPARQGETRAIRQAGRSYSTRGVGHSLGRREYEVRTMGKSARAKREEEGTESKLLPRTPPRSSRYHVHRTFLSVPRNRTPKRSPRDDEMMDIEKLTSTFPRPRG
ncbi:hypothetical protein TraAM80_06522 [Trypanosoma rangeli]|uniref:Uncharacterized protein n=1 Tax=Trypanosoma rangeli TaxID=5698 RepID=A0A422N9R3_TRYRA|nr:uncharacterized protein TraAM80_06522 [Trypanosoma rangeli]RNF02229.1 hypothetical protein TraAM80_06522 [Trypanosoma rangeli]|eukprot:RNF02229.1 hypothetical protein TraAM80_06522 [Trypanosoma rangeli]